MYTEGIKVGNNSYVLSDEDGNLKLVSGSSNIDDMKEFIKLENEYEEKDVYRNELQEDLSEICRLDKFSKKINIGILLYTIFGQMLCAMFGDDIALFIAMAAVTVGIGSLVKYGVCTTKKNRMKIKTETKEELFKITDELKTIKGKIDVLKEKMDYSEIDIYEDNNVPVTTVENKKGKVKIRVLKLEQSR